MVSIPNNEPNDLDDEAAVNDPQAPGDAGPGPDNADGAESPETAAEAPEASYRVGEVVTLPGRQDQDGNEGPRRVAIIVGVTEPDGDTPAVYDVARLPDATDRLFAGDLQHA